MKIERRIIMASVYSAGDFRNGTTFEMEGNVYRVVEFQHVKPGKGSAFVRTKLKNVISGAVIEKTFNPSEKYPGAEKSAGGRAAAPPGADQSPFSL